MKKNEPQPVSNDISASKDFLKKMRSSIEESITLLKRF